MIDNNADGSVCYANLDRTNDTLALLDSAPFMSVFCYCGRIVDLDRSEMQLKLSLGKELLCTHCRNKRISKELDALNDIYNGIVEEEC